IRDFFAYGYIPAPKSIFRTIYKLPAAHCLHWSEGRLRVQRYWTASPKFIVRDPNAAREQLGEILGETIRSQTVSDVPLGAFLSGGIDSATVCRYAAPVEAFTLGFDKTARSEVTAASAVAAQLRLPHRTVTAQAIEFEQALETIPKVYDEPFG